MPNILKFNIYPNFSREFIKGAMRNLIRDENIKDEDAEKDMRMIFIPMIPMIFANKSAY